MPSEQSIRRHQGLDFEEPHSPNRLGPGGESTALAIGETKPFLAQLLPQGSVFLLEVFDHVLLVPTHPAGEDQHQELKRQSVHQSEFRRTKSEEMGRNRRSSTGLSI